MSSKPCGKQDKAEYYCQSPKLPAATQSLLESMGNVPDFATSHQWTESSGPFLAKAPAGILQEPVSQLYPHQNHKLNEQPYPAWGFWFWLFIFLGMSCINNISRYIYLIDQTHLSKFSVSFTLHKTLSKIVCVDKIRSKTRYVRWSRNMASVSCPFWGL